MSASGFASGRGGGTTGAIRSQSASRAPDLEVRAQRAGDLLGDELS